MTDTSTETCRTKAKPPTQPEATDTRSVEVERLQRSEKTQTLTEKGVGFQEKRLRTLQRRYRIIYEKWRYHARLGREILTDEASREELNELIKNMKGTCSDVKDIYEELCCLQAPETELRRKVDTCISLSDFIIRKAEKQLK